MDSTTPFRFANLLTTGTLFGHEFCTMLTVHPALATLQPLEHIAAERALNSRAGGIMPFVMTSALASGLSLLPRLRRRPTEFLLVLLGTGSVAAVIGITFGGNMPLNEQIRVFPADPAQYPQFLHLQGSWNRLHTIRMVFNTIAISSFTLAHLLAARQADIGS